MPIFRLVDEPIFPRPDYADPSGLLAVGGDLSSERLLEAYRLGIFPWYSDDQPILWWSPDPRFVLQLEEFHISRSLRKTLRKGIFRVTIRSCLRRSHRCVRCRFARSARAAPGSPPEMKEAYNNLHGLGYAHSVETWFDGKLVGGIYGVSLGKAFFGESMFHRKTNASKVALAALVEKLKSWELSFSRRADDHRTHDESGRERSFPTGFFKAASFGVRASHQTRQMAHQRLAAC